MSRKKKRPQPRRPVLGPSESVAGVLDDLGEVVEDLQRLAVKRRQLDERLEDLVARARREGRTWTEVSRVLGVTPQAVQKRFRSSV